jgi:hypothetical protein
LGAKALKEVYLKTVMRRPIDITQPLLVLIAALAWFLAAASAGAQTLTVTVTNGAMGLGVIGSDASGSTIFTIDPSSGVVSTSGGATRATRIPSSNVTTPTVTVGCTGSSTCSNQAIYVSMQASLGAGSATRMQAPTTMTASMQTATLVANTMVVGNPTTFRISPIPKDQTKTFKIGANFVIGSDAAGTSGTRAINYSVTVAKNAAFSSGVVTASGSTPSMNIYKQLSMANPVPLAFGRIVRPPLNPGTDGTVIITSGGGRGVTGGAIILPSAFSRAQYDVTGEAGKAISVTVPSTFTMANGANTLTVTTNNTAVGILALSSPAGAYTFYVGGSFPLSATKPGGLYTGTFNVGVNYN